MVTAILLSACPTFQASAKVKEDIRSAASVEF